MWVHMGIHMGTQQDGCRPVWLRYFGKWQIEFSRRLRFFLGGGGQIVSGGIDLGFKIFWEVKKNR